MTDEAKKPDDGAAAIKHANGVASPVEAGPDMVPTSFRQPVLTQAQQAFVSHCQAILETVTWGTITKFQGFSANIVAIGMCRAMGLMVGTMFHGSLAEQGLAASPSPHLYQPQQPIGAGDPPYQEPAPGYGRQKVNGK
jgi:hypothetical protein